MLFCSGTLRDSSVGTKSQITVSIQSSFQPACVGRPRPSDGYPLYISRKFYDWSCATDVPCIFVLTTRDWGLSSRLRTFTHVRR